MSKNGWWSKDADITLTAIKYCELWYALKESDGVCPSEELQHIDDLKED